LKGTSALEGARASAAREELIDIDALEASDPPIAFLRPDFRVLSDASISLSNMCGTSCAHAHATRVQERFNTQPPNVFHTVVCNWKRTSGPISYLEMSEPSTHSSR
jgi:hypothetical protein